MTKYLGFDVGTRRTGVAFYEDVADMVLPLDTIEHESAAALEVSIATLAKERRVSDLVFGLPLLPSGKEGKQASLVRRLGERLTNVGFSCSFLDERHSTPRGQVGDGDAKAAFDVLSVYLAKKRA